MHYLKIERSLARRIGSFLNRLAEAWWRQLLSDLYRRRGFTLIYDRHFLFESAYLAAGSGATQSALLDRLEYRLMSRAYPKPDLVVFLNAPSEVLYRRKGETSPERLEQRSAAILREGGRMPNFVTVDASQTLDQVLASATGALHEFSRGRQPKPALRQGGGRKPHAVVVGLDHLNGLQTARILARRGVPVIGVVNDPDTIAARRESAKASFAWAAVTRR